MKPIDITKLETDKVKSLAYDIIQELNQLQQNLQIINAELKNRDEKNRNEKESVDDVLKVDS